MYDLIIIGSGPAGLSAGVYAQRARLNTLMLEKGFVNGGQVLTTYEVDNYLGMPELSGMALCEAFSEHAEKLGLQKERAEVLNIRVEHSRGEEGIKEDSTREDSSREGNRKDGNHYENYGADKKYFVVETKKKVYETKTIILATGAHHRTLGVPGENELSGMGVSYCATCDGAFFKGKTVAVVGGGDVALEDAIFLARGCKKVYVIHRRDEFRGAAILQEKLKALENVEILWDSVVEEILGENQVSALDVRNVKTGMSMEVEVDGVFIAVGITPNTELFEGLVDLDEGKYICAGEEGITSEPGIFAAGDVRTKALRQIITAASDGACAVTSVQNYLINI